MSKTRAKWLDSPFLRKIVDALGPDYIRFVGGAVRDTLVGRPIKDIDAATRWHPEQTTEKLEAAGIKVIPTGVAHGTVTAVQDGQHMEITTLRRDEETDGRHARVAFTDDWLEDAKRRDFTMNAIYMSSDGSLFDPFDGAMDARAGRVRFIGNAGDRIREDALRILRFFRFHAWYGQGEFDPAGLAAAKQDVALIAALSVERVRDELLKLLAAPDPIACLEAMTGIGLWQHTPVQSADIALLKTMIEAESKYEFLPDCLARLAALVDENGRNIGKVLKLSNKAQDLVGAARLGLRLRVPGNAAAMRSLIYSYGHMAAKVRLLTAMGTVEPDKIEVAKNWKIPAFPVMGRDLLAIGMEPGPDMSVTLRRLERIWVDSDFKLSRDELVAELSKQQSQQ